ncbi:hypothetical protein B0H63DRAFT_439552 [Podospora didyma]|uniref:Uncharacterized protein n=1 Tax=Podospora didyma TaxID=330526 RepID=A0AAE0KA94_9PEZI|nr:hypothetical protein B0H63DRAFT_439552 [Podospora didyma]
MLRRRQSVKSKPDLKRRKSTSSAHSVHLEHIDPAVAQRDAQIAACQAYTRAQSRTQADMSLFPPTPDSSPRRNLTDFRGSSRDDSVTPRHGRENSTDLRRRQSVRFVGSCSAQGRVYQDPIPYSRHNRKEMGPESAQVPDECDTNSTRSYALEGRDGHLAVRKPRQPSREPPPVPLPGIAAGYFESLVAAEEYYTPEDDIASAPSSYRRLRRSRSLFTSDDQVAIRKSQEGSISILSGKLPSSQQLPASNPRRMLQFDHKEKNAPSTTTVLRGPKSMSFLRNRATRSASNASRDGNMRSHGLAEKELDSGGQDSQQLTPKTSTFFGSKPRRNDPEIRKSLRSSHSIDGIGETDANLRTPQSKDEGFKTKARKVSKSLKTKLKTFFSLTKSEEEPASIPDQHIDSQKTHVTEGFASLLSSHADLESHDEQDWGSIHRVPAKMPSVQTVPANLIRSNRGSLESLRSERERKISDDKSMTSWVHSGPSTLTSQQQQMWKELERQRLSIITENGMHTPSSSFPRKALGTQLFQHGDSEIGKPGPPGPIVDSQRIFSALMKRSKAVKKQASFTEEQQRHLGTENAHPLRAISSAESLRGPLEGTPKTIRFVASHQNICNRTDPTATPTRGPKTDRLPDHRGITASQFRTGSPATLSSRQLRLEQATKEAIGLCAAFKAGRSRSGTDTSTTSEITDSKPSSEVHKDLPKSASLPPLIEEPKPLTDRGSAFFGSPTSHLFRTASPYRRALRKSMEEERGAKQQQESLLSEVRVSENGTQIHRFNTPDNTIRTNSESATNPDYTESVYSTDDYTTGAGQDGRDGSNKCEPPAAARESIPMSTPVTYQPAGYRADSSSVSSIDWKALLSANIAKLEPSPNAPKPSEIEFALPTMPKNYTSGHFRESAQINNDYDDEDTEELYEPPTHRPTLPTSPLAVVEPNVVKLSPIQRSVKRTTPPSSTSRPLMENDSPTGVAPPIPVKSPLRAVPSTLKLTRPSTSRSVTPSVSSSPGLTAAVQRQFGPVSSKRYDSTFVTYDGSHNDGDVYGSHRGGDSQPTGRLRMAELLQNGGLQRIHSSDETGAFL